MPNRRTSIKALRQSDIRKSRNLDFKTDLRKTIKKFTASINTKNTSEAQTNLKLVYKKLDKAAKHHLIHKNTASRRKSKYSRLFATLSPATA